MFNVLFFIVLLYTKKTTLHDLNWQIVFIPMYLLTTGICYLIFKRYQNLRDTNYTVYKRLAFHLLFCMLCLYLTFYFIGRIMNHQVTSQLSIFFHLIPLYMVLILTFGIYLYLLPGMCDLEFNITRKVPFLTLLYFIMITCSLIYFSINATQYLFYEDAQSDQQVEEVVVISPRPSQTST